ncbi:MAG: anthranilate phosphoribosyltransferase [Bacteriovoracaceae bacterium]
MKKIIQSLIQGQKLSLEKSEKLMDGILSGEAKAEQIGFILACFEFRSPTGEELAGLVKSLLKQSVHVSMNGEELVDVCGTGGDGLGMFNVSTCVSFVVAASGLKVAKHGNRAVSSRCGSFDVLEKLNMPISHNALEVVNEIEKSQLAFLYAPSFHPILKNIATLRQNLGTRTILNALGPLLNPARAKRQLIGVYSPKLLLPMAEALAILGTTEAMIVHGDDGSDEISLTTLTNVAHLKNGHIKQYQIDPSQYGLKTSSVHDLTGGLAEENSQIIKEVLRGKKGPCQDIVILNAGAALLVGNKVQTLQEGIELARATLESGKAFRLLEDKQVPLEVAV